LGRPLISLLEHDPTDKLAITVSHVLICEPKVHDILLFYLLIPDVNLSIAFTFSITEIIYIPDKTNT
jgi:hypothetical protein